MEEEEGEERKSTVAFFPSLRPPPPVAPREIGATPTPPFLLPVPMVMLVCAEELREAGADSGV